MVHDFAERIRRLGREFPSKRLWPVDYSLPQLGLARLAALQETERLRRGQVMPPERT